MSKPEEYLEAVDFFASMTVPQQMSAFRKDHSPRAINMSTSKTSKHSSEKIHAFAVKISKRKKTVDARPPTANNNKFLFVIRFHLVVWWGVSWCSLPFQVCCFFMNYSRAWCCARYAVLWGCRDASSHQPDIPTIGVRSGVGNRFPTLHEPTGPTWTNATKPTVLTMLLDSCWRRLSIMLSVFLSEAINHEQIVANNTMYDLFYFLSHSLLYILYTEGWVLASAPRPHIVFMYCLWAICLGGG